MYVCICICIHVNVCHVYIVCHAYIYTCVYLVRVDLDIILLVVSDGHDSAKGWKSLFEYVGLFEVHELYEFFVHPEHRGRRVLRRKMIFLAGKNRYFEPKGVDLCPSRGSLWAGEGNGNYRNATIPVTIPRSIPGNYGKSHP